MHECEEMPIVIRVTGPSVAPVYTAQCCRNSIEIGKTYLSFFSVSRVDRTCNRSFCCV